jgi:hypothetical protein
MPRGPKGEQAYEAPGTIQLEQPGTEIRTAGLVNRRGSATPRPNMTLVLAPVAEQSGPIFVRAAAEGTGTGAGFDAFRAGPPHFCPCPFPPHLAPPYRRGFSFGRARTS